MINYHYFKSPVSKIVDPQVLFPTFPTITEPLEKPKTSVLPCFGVLRVESTEIRLHLNSLIQHIYLYVDVMCFFPAKDKSIVMFLRCAEGYIYLQVE